MTSLTLLAAGMWGIAAAILAITALSPSRGGDDPTRREAVTRADRISRWFGGWVERTAATIPATEAALAEADLRIADEPIPWTGSEYLARGRVAGRVLGVATAVACGLAMGWAVAPLGVVVAWWLPEASRRELAARAGKRIARIRHRLPFAIDLIVAQLTAGAATVDTLRSAAGELAGHPAGGELGRLARAIDGGQSLAFAVRDSAVMQADPDLRQIAAELARGEEQGVSLVATFHVIARQLRSRQTARSERAAEEARAKLGFPVVLISLACLAVLITPFILHTFTQL
jgi:hypothetical protein